MSNLKISKNKVFFPHPVLSEPSHQNWSLLMGRHIMIIFEIFISTQNIKFVYFCI
jgi:hypothetical protein